MKKIILSVLAIAVFLSLVSGASAAENPPDFIIDLSTKIKTLEFPDIPETINKQPASEMEGYEELQNKINNARKLRGEIIGEILIYRDIFQKHLKFKAREADTKDEVELSRIFPQGFKPFKTEGILTDSEFPLSPQEKQAAERIFTDRLRVLDLKRYEEDLIDFKTVTPKAGRVFYDNARAKMENYLKDDMEALDAYIKELPADVERFKKQAVKINFKIGTSKSYSGVKKNFDENEHYIIGFEYNTQGLEESIPIEWKVKFPDGRDKSGTAKLESGISNEYFQIMEGDFVSTSPKGQYEVEVKVFPGQNTEKAFTEYFWLSGGDPFKITSVFVLNEKKKPAEFFKPGDTILLAMRYKPYDNRIEKAQFTWRVFDSSGSEVPSLSTSKELSVWSGASDVKTKFIKGVIPKEAVDGEYSYQTIIRTGADSIMSDVVRFVVESDFIVKIDTDKTTAKSGEKIVFTARIFGGKKPYTILWKSDTLETSTHPSIAVVFNQPGKRWVTLTVTDSSNPQNKKTVKTQVTITEI